VGAPLGRGAEQDKAGQALKVSGCAAGAQQGCRGVGLATAFARSIGHPKMAHSSARLMVLVSGCSSASGKFATSIAVVAAAPPALRRLWERTPLPLRPAVFRPFDRRRRRPASAVSVGCAVRVPREWWWAGEQGTSAWRGSGRPWARAVSSACPHSRVWQELGHPHLLLGIVCQRPVGCEHPHLTSSV
jgi:hypothetical protein